MKEQARRLRRRFLALGTCAVILIVVVVLGALNLASFYGEARNIESVLLYIARNHGAIPVRRAAESADFDYTPEFTYQTRYFYALFRADGTVESIDISHISAVRREEAIERARNILASGDGRGIYVVPEEGNAYYAYLIAPRENGEQAVIVMDATREMLMIWKIFRFSIVVGLICILLYVVLVAYFSRRLTEPFIRNLESQRRFITNAGHELRTPIAIISANTEVIEMTGGKSEWTQTILKQVKRLNGLVTSLVQLAKLQENVAGAFEKKDVDFSETVREVAHSFTEPLKEQGKSLASQVAEDVHIEGDSRMLYTLANVFVDNAVKYCDEGGTVQVALTREKKNKNSVTLAVTNPYKDGEGQDYTKFFERFYRADESHSSGKSGYGIGLTIASEIVRYQKGQIGIRYADGAITFYATLRTLPKA